MQSTFTAATFNIWNRFGPWDERLPVLRRQLAALAPDVIGLQEVLRLDDGTFDQVALVSEGLPGVTYHGAWGKHPGGRYPVGNALLSRWPISKTEAIALPGGGSEEESRVLLFCEVDAPFGKLPVFVTHLNWKLHEGHVRVGQTKFVAKAIAERASIQGVPPVLLGDFNAEPDSDEMRYLRGLTGLGGHCVYFADCFAAAGQGDGTTFARRNPYALACHEPDRRIDYVYVRGPDDRGRGEPLSARVCFDEAENGVFASDHFGVIATLAT